MTRKIYYKDKIVVVCNNGIFRSLVAYWFMKNAGYENVDYGGARQLSWRRITPEMLESANYIVSVHPYTTRLIERMYTLGSGQQLIQLDVPDLGLKRGVRVVRTNLENQIRAFFP